MVAGQQRAPGRFPGFLFPQACRILRKLKEQKIRFNHHIIMNRTFLLALTLGGLLLAALGQRQGWFQRSLPSSQTAASGVTVAARPLETNADSSASNSLEGSPAGATNPRRGVEEIVGIGAALAWDEENHCPLIRDVVPHSPAAKGGLASGWLISKINDVPASNMNLQECISLLRGAVGSKVKLELVHLEDSATNTVELIRQQIRL
ncbi:MAG: hypothetical protein JWM16_4756 [Verrucomicrobiales bacterium]|nr:hypothetical protein [Verrucomicrobiales bacterium]